MLTIRWTFRTMVSLRGYVSYTIHPSWQPKWPVIFSKDRHLFGEKSQLYQKVNICGVQVARDRNWKDETCRVEQSSTFVFVYEIFVQRWRYEILTYSVFVFTLWLGMSTKWSIFADTITEWRKNASECLLRNNLFILSCLFNDIKNCARKEEGIL